MEVPARRLHPAEPAVSDAECQHPDPIPHQRSSETYSAFRPPWRDAILQPPKPQITPSAQIRQIAVEHDIEPEAGG